LQNVIKHFPSCDHYPIIFKLHRPPDKDKNKKVIHFRKIKDIDHERFSHDLNKSLPVLEKENKSFSDIITQFGDGCVSVLNSHVSKITKTIIDVPSAPWFDGEYKLARAERRKAEKAWRTTGLDIDNSIFVHLRKHCNELSDRKKKLFFKETFQKYNHSQRSLYKFVDTFLDRDSELTLPSSEDLQETVNAFNQFFTEKVEKIRSSFPSIYKSYDGSLNFDGTKLTEFRKVTILEVEEIIKESGIKTSAIDPLPKELLCKHIELILPT
jgi:hypothetical protein